ncbi:6-phosphogluconate dehydrogenase [Microdochium trichocladiopsis]|uniref:6-phosphogluconate dehydrogenase n=1 Tax=Microdochium trichocladiopsis TaxID=1682393 RepID=A0A9P8Y799_9PEZI|nr:6-phosphogluconate dehydrogenase [Microdochium trichocladiopsis]KAH7031584.1 6-phosphogluconate dehydrogenase [Microdochium trichocladiopsis]
MAAAPLAKIGILSIGDMGMGIAKLLVANGFAVATNGKGRSNDTIDRAKAAKVELLNSDEDLCEQCAVILSVVPPRDAVATAQRIIDAAITGPFPRKATDGKEPLYFADLNAVAPSTIKSIAELFDKASSKRPETAVRFIDGSIIGGPPALAKPAADAAWKRPSIPTSGPHSIGSISDFGPKLSTTLNMRHISPTIGAASGLKMCFASLSKGFTALAIQSFTTASRLGVLDELTSELATHSPASLKTAQFGLTGMPPKAYRWVREMEEINRTFEEEGGFQAGRHDIFGAVAEVYKSVAEETVLGEEKIGKRKRGQDAADVAAAMAEGLEKRKKKND